MPLKKGFLFLAAAFAAVHGLGCGELFEATAVKTRFREIYSCAPDEATQMGGRWVVKGCGVTALFICRAYDENGGLLDHAMMGDQVCDLKYSKGPGEPPQPVERFTIETTPDNHRRLRALIYSGENRIIMVGIPESYPNEIGFDIALEADVQDSDGCTVRFFADGEPVPGIGEVFIDRNRKGVRFTVDDGALGWMGGAGRLVADVCGRELAINPSDIELLCEFDVRFREELHRAEKTDNKTP